MSRTIPVNSTASCPKPFQKRCAGRWRSGIDCVSDGETSKIGYATYIKNRLTGFSGDSPRQIALDLQPSARVRARMAVFAGEQRVQAAILYGQYQLCRSCRIGKGHFAFPRRPAEASSPRMDS